MNEIWIQKPHAELLVQSSVVLVEFRGWNRVAHEVEKVQEASAHSVQCHQIAEIERFAHGGGLFVPVFGHPLDEQCHLSRSVILNPKAIL